jgi:hypothetical protein
VLGSAAMVHQSDSDSPDSDGLGSAGALDDDSDTILQTKDAVTNGGMGVNDGRNKLTVVTLAIASECDSNSAFIMV